MARPKRTEGEQNIRDQILDAARLEFSVHGISARLEDVAARCQIRRSSLLHHFNSKHALLEAVIERAAATANERILDAAAASRGDYGLTIRRVTEVLRNLEREEQGIASILLQAMMANGDFESTRERVAFLLQLVTTLAIQAGAGEHHAVETVQAAIAHVVMGELSRLALGEQANRYWGNGDAITPLIDGFFLGKSK